MRWLVTGGAGYVGAHVVRALFAEGLRPVVVDNLSTGLAERVPPGVEFVRMDVAETAFLTDLLQAREVEGVIHMAAKKSIEDSMKDPILYWRQNVVGFLSVLNAASAANVGSILLSSSSSVYGGAHGAALSEDAPTIPVNPYGETKLACEQILRAYGFAHGVRWIALRYFNVAGIASGIKPDRHDRSLLPLLLDRLRKSLSPQIFGNDYPTSDGTCIRDYVHVMDVAQAHVTSAMRIEQQAVNTAFNIGRGVGVSVAEVVESACRITGVPMKPDILHRRAGDAPEVVGSVVRVREALGWRAKLSLDDMITSAWRAFQGETSQSTLESST